MIAELDIQNFRGLRHVKLTGLKRVNLIVGGNDTGKTSILEALVLLLGDGSALRNLPITFRTNQSGGQSVDESNDRENFWSWLFYDRSSENEIGISASLTSPGTITVRTERLQTPILGIASFNPF